MGASRPTVFGTVFESAHTKRLETPPQTRTPKVWQILAMRQEIVDIAWMCDHTTAELTQVVSMAITTLSASTLVDDNHVRAREDARGFFMRACARRALTA